MIDKKQDKKAYAHAEKAYMQGTLFPYIKVGMQKVNLTPTVNIVNGEKVTTPNAPVYIYDTSGPFSDPNMEIDLKKGLPRMRESWIIGRGDVEKLPSITSEYGKMRRDDKSLDHLRFEHIALPYRAKAGKAITQMAYAKAGIVTPEMEYVAIRENMNCRELGIDTFITPEFVRDEIATIYLHNNMLEYGHTYYVTIDNGVLNLADGSFQGVTKEDEWTFTTKSDMPELSDTLIVDATGKGDFNTVQGALDFIPDFNEQQTVILVNPGDYEELVYTRNKWNVKIKGAGMADTKVHYANNEVFNPHPLTVKTNGWPGTFPSRRAAFMLDNCKDIVIEDMTIATDLKGQAEGLLINGERIALYRVHIIGSGDALQANGTIYMESCELDGGGDTILGRGSLFAYKSNFRNGGGPFSWVRNTAGNHGNVFVECTFSTEDGKQADYGRTKSNHGSAYPDAEFVLIDCKVKNIIPEGWSSIGAKTAKMYEYNTCDMVTGNPVDVSKRHPYSRQLTKDKDTEMINNYRNPAFVLKGWLPDSYMNEIK